MEQNDFGKNLRNIQKSSEVFTHLCSELQMLFDLANTDRKL